MDDLDELIEESTRLDPAFPHLLDEARQRVAIRRIFSRSKVRYGTMQSNASTRANASASQTTRIDAAKAWNR